MTAEELFRLLATTYSLHSQIICDLHNPCESLSKRRCSDVLTHELINFDKVKIAFYKGQPVNQRSSADGFTYQKDWFCFVELKGWRDYIMHNADASQSDIQEQADKYDLSKKYQDSMYICEQVPRRANYSRTRR